MIAPVNDPKLGESLTEVGPQLVSQRGVFPSDRSCESSLPSAQQQQAANVSAESDNPAQVAQPQLNSAIYQGRILHRRHRPKPHQFCYSIYMAWIDLDEVDRLFSTPLWCSRHWFSAVEFRRSDYYGDPATDLADSIRQLVLSRTGVRPTGPIRLLTHLRYFGFTFNPVSFYYCYADDGCTLEVIVAEVTNTPWREKHTYIIPCSKAVGPTQAAATDSLSEANNSSNSGQAAIVFACPKEFHVSPFLEMAMDYHWRLTQPAQTLSVEIKNVDSLGCIFEARLELSKRSFGKRQLALALLRFPLVTVKVVLAIYWQALKIWWKKVPYVPHP
jgi:uncharacterized protein